jgi:3-isopropylmalate dehydrogenase
MILSVAMMLRFSLDMPEAASAVEAAVGEVIGRGVMTRDLGGSASTAEVGDNVVACLRERVETE